MATFKSSTDLFFLLLLFFTALPAQTPDPGLNTNPNAVVQDSSSKRPYVIGGGVFVIILIALAVRKRRMKGRP